MVRGHQSPRCHLLNHMEGWGSLDLFLGGLEFGDCGTLSVLSVGPPVLLTLASRSLVSAASLEAVFKISA